MTTNTNPGTDAAPTASAPSELYQAALTALETLRGFAATCIEDHAKDSYTGNFGCRPQDVAPMWASEIHGIDAKAFLDEAIADRAPAIGQQADSGYAAVKQAADRADQSGFEAWANGHGGLPLDLAGNAMKTDDGLALPTYKFGRTEIAWRAWANKPAHLSATNSSTDSVDLGATVAGEVPPVAQVRSDLDRVNVVWFGPLPPHGTNLYTAPAPQVAPDLPDPLKYGCGVTNQYVNGYNDALREVRAAIAQRGAA
jgi:hypothetical protein